MKVYKSYESTNVYEAAVERIEWLFDEFGDNLVVNFSGGKDSTICLHLCLEVARRRGALPLKVMFLDQEAEWRMVIDYIRETFASDEIEAHWLQIPIQISNSTSDKDDWLWCWEEGREWMRPKEPGSIQENVIGQTRFKKVFDAFLLHLFPDEPACYVGGVRGEESPTRMTGLTHYPTYKWATWGRMMNKAAGHVTMYPIFDWSYTDVWKAIHDNGWPYAPLYDLQYQHGVPLPRMRVSNLHHETAVKELYYLQEVEPDTWAALTRRLRGVATAGQLKDDAFSVDELPGAFSTWVEYRDYLVTHLISEEKQHFYRKRFKDDDIFYDRLTDPVPVWKVQIKSILKGDWEFTLLHNLSHNPKYSTYRRLKRGHPVKDKWMSKFGGVFT